MSSWQATVLNLLLSYVARPSISRGKAKLSLLAVREKMRYLDSRWQPWPDDFVVKTLALSQSKLLHYQLQDQLQDPLHERTHDQCSLIETAPTPSLFYVRGGGFCFKTPHVHGRFLAYLARACAVDVYVPDYRLSPENPYPAPLDDVIEAYQTLLTHQSADNIIVMGDSAGGNLALSLLLELKTLALPLPRACVLLSPALDLALTGDTELTLAADDPMFTIESLLRLRGAYLAGSSPMSPRVSPLEGDLSGLPPILVIAGTRELLLQDSQRLLKQITALGGMITARFYPNMPHVFPLFDKVPEAEKARQQIVDFIRQQWCHKS